MDVDPGYDNFENIRGGIQWYMMQIKDFVSGKTFTLKNENLELVSVNGQSITFRLSVREFQFST